MAAFLGGFSGVQDAVHGTTRAVEEGLSQLQAGVREGSRGVVEVVARLQEDARAGRERDEARRAAADLLALRDARVRISLCAAAAAYAAITGGAAWLFVSRMMGAWLDPSLLGGACAPWLAGDGGGAPRAWPWAFVQGAGLLSRCGTVYARAAAGCGVASLAAPLLAPALSLLLGNLWATGALLLLLLASRRALLCPGLLALAPHWALFALASWRGAQRAKWFGALKAAWLLLSIAFGVLAGACAASSEPVRALSQLAWRLLEAVGGPDAAMAFA